MFKIKKGIHVTKKNTQNESNCLHGFEFFTSAKCIVIEVSNLLGFFSSF